MINGLGDALIVWRAVPAPVLQELFRTGKVEFLPIDPQMLAGLRLNQPFVVPDTIPAGAYDKQDHSVSTAAVKSVLVASSAVDPKLVKDILAIIFESIPELIAHHPRAAEISRGSAFRLEDGMPIRLHPAAEEFFQSASSTR